MLAKTLKQRVTITLSPEVIALYQDVSNKSGQSFSATINDWLESTGPALEQLTQQVLDVKSRPAQVLNNLMLFQEQMEGQLSEVKDEIRSLIGANGEIEGQPSPHSNTGLKLFNPPAKRG